ncbi:hypothetical protein AAZX31_05G100000 [Glycine max]|uniref:Uncharacterized protein n=2 Tax=Glycine subgen. Soja TaxID=1462606 RepID=I1K2G0_SOYBN|nr:hypothetical protein JHK87_012489 [Glycine soja]KAG5057593.1 hypothetical protein JHK86_012589 [Glycine max]KAG5154606.1 hypothetical protein JHK82_012575 [Glycine max]KAH1133798.1 hypothetical protein GYH30_012273 [Glycine max]KAH1250118.1 hypothetical protein GmHk_05G013344 [Glycine max]
MKVNTGFVSMSCTGTCFSKGKGVKNSSSDACTCRKLDGGVAIASWLCQSVASAFFASLEWCSCFHVDTINDIDGPPDDGDSSSTFAPFILNAEKEDSLLLVPKS